MADDKRLEQLKREAAEKAKAAALAKMNRDGGENGREASLSSDGPTVHITSKKVDSPSEEKGKAKSEDESTTSIKVNIKEQNKETIENDEGEKAKALALAKAKAAAAAKAKIATQNKDNHETVNKEEEKAKAIAIAKAKAAAAAKAKMAAEKQEGGDDAPSTDDEKAKAKAIAIAKAKAAAAARMKSEGKSSTLEQESEKEVKPSENQPLLDLINKELKKAIGSDCIEESYINTLSKDVPTFIVQKEDLYKICKCLKENEKLQFDYFNLLHGTDYKTHFEIYIHLRSYKFEFDIALKVKIDRENPVVDSLTSIWQGVSWSESEAYDLLGIKFKGNPHLHRIFLGESWVGYPLRKDYQPYEEDGGQE